MAYLYSQVEKSLKEEPLGHEAKYRNALVSYYLGEFGWAETKLDVPLSKFVKQNIGSRMMRKII